MDVDPSTPANLPVTSDQERELLSSATPESEGKPKKLGGAARKRLNRLHKSGIPHNSASKQILEKREQKQRIQTPSEQAGTSKRVRSSDDPPEVTVKKPGKLPGYSRTKALDASSKKPDKITDPGSCAKMTVIASSRESTKSAGPPALRGTTTPSSYPKEPSAPEGNRERCRYRLSVWSLWGRGQTKFVCDHHDLQVSTGKLTTRQGCFLHPWKKVQGRQIDRPCLTTGTLERKY
ncbi:hypothetical protein JTB14_003241 [Gonioctena quinquepunctata]|nr:hypothetical protein JTB14_003241 [Gonioctena quinquepunctata]